MTIILTSFITNKKQSELYQDFRENNFKESAVIQITDGYGTGRYLLDFEKWISMDKEKPSIGMLVEITDADSDGWCDFVFHGYLKNEKFYAEDGHLLCAAYTISYWKYLED